MGDDSHLDAKYFIDNHVFNCPFCNRRNVAYKMTHFRQFDWTKDKKCYVHFAHCDSCSDVSMHLSFEEIPYTFIGNNFYRFSEADELDEKFFYSVPTSFFILDNRVPESLRKLMTEAEGCLKSNFLTGAFVCARKIVYELARIEGADGANYDARLISLKNKRTDVESDYFDTLLTIQQVTSDKVHEESYDGWSSKHLRLILSTLQEVLTIMYVIPEVRKEKRQTILAMKSEIIGKKSAPNKPN